MKTRLEVVQGSIAIPFPHLLPTKSSTVAIQFLYYVGMKGIPSSDTYLFSGTSYVYVCNDVYNLSATSQKECLPASASLECILITQMSEIPKLRAVQVNSGLIRLLQGEILI